MSQVIVTLQDYIPLPRVDALPWTHAIISESDTSDGTYVDLVTQTLSPVDTDTADPMSRSFTFVGTMDSGWYKVTFVDAEDVHLPMTPVQNLQEVLHPYTPSLQQVGQVILSRTKDKFTKVLGTFTSDTQPNNIQAMAEAKNGARDVSIEIGDTIPATLLDDAQRLAAIRAAMAIELAYFSDQVNTGRSIYPQLNDMWKMQLASLKVAVQNSEEGDGSVEATSPSGFAEYAFPSVPPIQGQLT